jgi:HlyD family secretion protein
LALLLAGGLMTARSLAQPPATTVVGRQTLQAVLEISGVVESARHVKLTAEATGAVARLLVDENQHVAEGTPLLRIQSAEAQLQLTKAESDGRHAMREAETIVASARTSLEATLARSRSDQQALERQVAKAEATLVQADRELARQERLFAQGAVTRQATDEARDTARQARLDLAIAKDNLAKGQASGDATSARNTLAQALDGLASARDRGRLAVQDARLALAKAELKAPFAGTLVDWSVAVGDYVSPGTAVATLVDLASLRLVLPADELDLPRLKSGMPVAITFSAYPDAPVEGRIARIGRTSRDGADDVKAYPVEVAFPNSDGRIRPGMNGDARLVLEERRQVLAVPLTSVVREKGALRVYVVQGGQPKPVPIEVGLATVDAMEVVHGLSEGDRILADPVAAGVVRP